MEQLSAHQKETITRMSTTRLLSKLMQIGFTEEQLETMERADMLNAFALAVVEGRDKPIAAKEKPHAPLYYDPAVEKLRLEFEAKKFEEELAMKREELERQERIRQEELALKQQEIDVRRAQLKIEEERAAIALQGQERQRLREKARDAAENERRSKTVTRAKMLGQAMQNILPKMPSDPVELISFFEIVEDLFHKFEIPADLQATLLHPHLTEKARSLMSHLDSAARSDFALVMKCLLDQFHLTPQEKPIQIQQCDETV